jgi:L-alanine-DL-glutamate epimerase-like enolase superfamily enzyme
MTQIAFLFAEIATLEGHEGVGYSYSKRAGGPGLYAHAKEIADDVIGEDPNDIQRIWTKLVWAGASVGRSGLATQAIAAIDIALWDLKAKRAGLPLAKLLGAHRDSVACYNTSGGFFSSPLEEIIENAHNSLERGIGGIKIKVGQPDTRVDLERVRAVREHLGDAVVVPGDHLPERLRVEPLTERSGPHEVAEDHRDRLANLPAGTGGGERRPGSSADRGERRPADPRPAPRRRAARR